MIRGVLGIISLSLILAFVIALAKPVFAQEGEMQSVEGTVICVEVDEKGNMVTKTDVTMCKGALFEIGADGKAYAISGTAEQAKQMMKTGKKQTVSGIISGHERGWILAAASAEHPQAAASGDEVKVTGTIVCLLPNYQDLSFKQVVATGPCNEIEPHAHVVRTKDGQVYALHGSEESIKKIESMSDRNEVELQGKIQGEQGAWVLFVN